MLKILLICLSMTMLFGCEHAVTKQNGPNYRFDDFPLGHDLNPIEVEPSHAS